MKSRQRILSVKQTYSICLIAELFPGQSTFHKIFPWFINALAFNEDDLWLCSKESWHLTCLCFALRSILQQLLVSITFPNFLNAGEFPSIWRGERNSDWGNIEEALDCLNDLIMEIKGIFTFNDKALKDIEHIVCKLFKCYWNTQHMPKIWN